MTKEEAKREMMFAKRNVIADSWIDKAYDMAIKALAQPEPEIYWGYTPTHERPLADVEIVSRLRDIQKQIPGGSYAIDRAIEIIEAVASAQPELPSYVAETEEEYRKAVKSPYIHKPLAKALYEVWKKHDREDVERRTDG